MKKIILEKEKASLEKKIAENNFDFQNGKDVVLSLIKNQLNFIERDNQNIDYYEKVAELFEKINFFVNAVPFWDFADRFMKCKECFNE